MDSDEIRGWKGKVAAIESQNKLPKKEEFLRGERDTQIALLVLNVTHEIIRTVYLKRKRIGNPSLNTPFRQIHTVRVPQRHI